MTQLIKKKKKIEEMTRVPHDKLPLEKKGLPIVGGPKVNRDIKEPVLFLIRSNRTVDLFENVKPGTLKVEMGDAEIGNIILTPQKLLSIKWGSDYLRGWMAFEGEANPYPIDVKQDSRQMRHAFQSVVMAYKNYKEKDPHKHLGDTFLKAGMGLAVVLFVWFMFGDKIIPPESTEAASQSAVEYATQTAGFIISFIGGILV